MSRALHTAATGMMAQQQQIDNIANNLANSSTVGFKRTRLEFQDILFQSDIERTARLTYRSRREIGRCAHQHADGARMERKR
ncbi:flagellar basal body protein, partial [Pyrinomonas methylaliphatogenes]